MISLLSQIKRRIPWWGKIAIKVTLSRIPLAYRVWKRLSMFEHGPMESPEYALKVFLNRTSVAGFGPRLRGAALLELGPGDSLFSALIARAYGADKTYLVDVGNYCERDLSAYEGMAQKLADMGMDIRPEGGFRDFGHMLEHCNAVYLTDGLQSLMKIPDKEVDFIWSQAVLEHIREGEFSNVLTELRRISRDDGVGSHEIDLADHLGGALDNLRFSRRVWESLFFADAGFYTNRIRYSQMLDYFRLARFDADVFRVDNWDDVPTSRKDMVQPYSGLPDHELVVKVFEVVLRPGTERF